VSRTSQSVSQLMLVSFILLILHALASCSSYKSQSYTDLVLKSSDSVTVSVTSSEIIFEPTVPYTNAVVFYPGAKVDFAAYSPILRELAENGIYCVLCRMPADFAFMDIGKAKSVIESKPDLSWYIAGHSLGGAMAAYYAAAHAEEVKGLIMLAAYSTSDISQTNLRVLTMYGSNDKVLNHENFRKYAANLPSTARTVVIDGGNHSQFGDYGFQKGDGEAFIPTELQVLQTSEAILQLMR